MAEQLSPEEEQRRRAALAQVRKWGDPVLRERARPVEAFDDALHAEVARLTGLLDDALGAGLAATQIGVLSRVFVYRMPDGPMEVMVNPEILWASDELELFDEGCLSLPGVWFEVERPRRVRVRAFDEHGAEREFEVEGAEADVIQHELDHLDGVLVLDRVPQEQRKAAIRRLRELDAAA
jgi:peptide deformylase